MKLATLKINNSRNIEFIKSLVPPAMYQLLYKNLIVKDIPSNFAYKPHYSPWLEPAFADNFNRIRGYTGLRPESVYTLLHFLEESLWLEGDVMECGVWRGGSAKLIYESIYRNATGKRLHLFDSFEGMREIDAAQDRHEAGDFKDTSLDLVKGFVMGSATAGDSESTVAFHKGWIPESFAGLDDLKLCFAHIDLDLYQSILDTLAFVYPRLSPRGVIVFDDYGFASCSGARKAVDEYFADKPESPFALHTGQALVVKR